MRLSLPSYPRPSADEPAFYCGAGLILPALFLVPYFFVGSLSSFLLEANPVLQVQVALYKYTVVMVWNAALVYPLWAVGRRLNRTSTHAHHLFALPFQYWGPVFLVIGIVFHYLWKWFDFDLLYGVYPSSQVVLTMA